MHGFLTCLLAHGLIIEVSCARVWTSAWGATGAWQLLGLLQMCVAAWSAGVRPVQAGSACAAWRCGVEPEKIAPHVEQAGGPKPADAARSMPRGVVGASCLHRSVPISRRLEGRDLEIYLAKWI